MSKSEIYFSTDIEADGPIPGPNSMLSFGTAAFSEAGALISTFTENLELLPEATPDPDTMEWWKKQGDAWDKARVNAKPPPAVMRSFANWVTRLSKEHDAAPVFVGYPAGFDFMFVYWYLIKFNRHSPFSFSALDMKTYAMRTLGTPYRETTKKNFPKSWIPKDRPHTHVALDDAIEQGEMFLNMLRHGR